MLRPSSTSRWMNTFWFSAPFNKKQWIHSGSQHHSIQSTSLASLGFHLMPDTASVSPASQATSSQLPFPDLLPLQNLKCSDSVLVHALFSFYILSLGFKFSGGGGIGKGVRAVWGCHNDGVEAPLPAFSGWGPKRPNRGQYHQRTVQPKSNTHPH